MCSLANCPKCRKFTYSGCGRHLKQLFARYHPSSICSCGPGGKPLPV